jgi:hypothetical protein
MAAIVCPVDCTALLPAVVFSECNPELNASEIIEVYLAKGSAEPLTLWSDPAEWATRMALATAEKIVQLVVSGDKPAPTSQIRDYSNFRKAVITKDHVLNFTIDETNVTNHDFVRNLECGGTYRMWYKTQSGHMFGGNEGVICSLDSNMVLNRGESEVITFETVATWKSKFTEERIVSPI